MVVVVPACAGLPVSAIDPVASASGGEIEVAAVFFFTDLAGDRMGAIGDADHHVCGLQTFAFGRRLGEVGGRSPGARLG